MLSIFELFKIGIGPSSSHTVGPMRAANLFIEKLEKVNLLAHTGSLRVELFGSLALTGKGHGTDKAVILGLEGNKADTIDADAIDSILQRITDSGTIQLSSTHTIPFDEKVHLQFLQNKSLKYHPNGMKFYAYDSKDTEILQQTYYSVGGGFVVTSEDAAKDKIDHNKHSVPFQFSSFSQLRQICTANNLTVHDVVMANETISISRETVFQQALKIWDVMQECVRRGFRQEGVLPGGLSVKRRAPRLYREYTKSPERGLQDPLSVLDWINLYALAVNEENAAGGRIVTAPTNGAAGIVPAVMHYYSRFIPRSDDEDRAISAYSRRYWHTL